jgi:tetratricopeptide (TPR) repeat protein
LAVQSRGIIPEIIDTLLKRCIEESDSEVRGLLATCIGEIGAIGPNKLADMDADWGASNGQGSGMRRSKPWDSVDSPGFEILTTHLVAALKSAPSAIDQHKVAFAIQQLMAILNLEMEDTPEACTESSKYQKVMAASGSNRASMNIALAKKLSDKGVYDVVEPFYLSEFQEADSSHAPRLPPFFRLSVSFYEWLSNWCRHMIRCCVQVRSDKWSAIFHACRTALRSSEGIKLAEYLLPTLISYQLCFGRGRDHDSMLFEIVDVMNPDTKFRMPLADKRNAVSVLFSAFAILEGWMNKQVKGSKNQKMSSPNEWSRSEPENRISVLLKKIPYQQRATAAASVGMYACSLRLFEISAREEALVTALPMFTGPLSCYHPTKSTMAGLFDAKNNLVKKSLLELGDLETLTQIDEDPLRSDNAFFIARKEAIGDWQGALDEYERALQMDPDDVNLRLGNMRCSLQLGHFETVLQISKGFNHADGTDFAVEACCRLGRWEALGDLTEKFFSDGNTAMSISYQWCIGEAMLKLKNRNYRNLFSTTEKAKQIVMEDMSRAARESYGRAYEHVVKLQILQEIEEVGNLFMRGDNVEASFLLEESLDSWDKRLNLMAADGAMSVVKTRITLAHLARDRTMEARLFLQLGRRARKQGLANVAASSLARADAVARCIESPQPMDLLGNLQIEAAKLKHGLGECSTALRLVDLEVPTLLHEQQLTYEGNNFDKFTQSKVRSALKATKWMIEGGLKGSTEIMARFKLINDVAPTFNKGGKTYAY